MRARGPLLIAILCAIPIFLWTGSAQLDNRFLDLPTSLTSIAVVLGFAGFVAYAANILLGARIKPLSSWLGGLDNMYALHRVNGRVAFLLVLAHGLLMIAGRAAVSFDEVKNLFSPSLGWAAPLGVIALLLMTVAIGLTLYARVGHEMFVYIQRSLGVIFVVASLHVFLTPGAKATSAPLTIYLGIIAAAAILAFGYRSLFGDVLVRRHEYDVRGVRHLDPSVEEITMAPRGRPLDFIPGQFVFVTFYSDAFSSQFHPFSVTPEGGSAIISLRPGDSRNQWHPFSITSGLGEKELRVVVKAVGDYTTAMRRLDERAVARVEGPYGSFSHLQIPNPKQIWIAGGIGITPFLSMARSLGGNSIEVDLYYGSKSLEAAHFLDELLMISETNERLRVIPFPEDKLGVITADYIEGTSKDIGEKAVLICGPPAMIDSLSAQFLEKGVPRANILFEKFGFGRS
ncbi:MAG TPA: ferric reductase-like transmembrane domain-containing protein [Actinomycetota bacterium]|nr:ferric reductase-like transmembrane domain-containing protein [Actinomycetota bacterium]